MFNSTYGAGYRAGYANAVVITRADGTKIIGYPECPFAWWRPISRALWFSGLFEGQIKRLSAPMRGK
jgi:hypothetical protein